jgi:hypothetical protein
MMFCNPLPDLVGLQKSFPWPAQEFSLLAYLLYLSPQARAFFSKYFSSPGNCRGKMLHSYVFPGKKHGVHTRIINPKWSHESGKIYRLKWFKTTLLLQFPGIGIHLHESSPWVQTVHVLVISPQSGFMTNEDGEDIAYFKFVDYHAWASRCLW